MQDMLLVFSVLCMFAFGFLLMKRLDKIIENHRKERQSVDSFGDLSYNVREHNEVKRNHGIMTKADFGGEAYGTKN